MKILKLAALLLVSCTAGLQAQNVGIGTTNPLSEIHLNSPGTYLKVLLTPTTLNDTSSILFGESLSANLGMEWLYDGGSNRMKLYGRTGATTFYGPHISVNRGPATRVGIGVNSASEVLEVGGAIRLGTTTSSNAGSLRWTGTDFEGYDGSDWNTLTGESKWNEQILSDNIFFSAGDVGIGVSSPDYLLDIENDDSNRSINISATYDGASTQSGVHANLVNQGSGNKYGFYSQVGNGGANNANTLYGLYSYIPFAASGQHFGVYSDASGNGHYAIYGRNTYSTGWAGFFEGRGHVSEDLTIGSETSLGQLHVHSNAGDKSSIYVTPPNATSSDSAMLFLAEDRDADLGMSWIYDGIDDQMKMHGHVNGAVHGPHLSVRRNDGEVSIGTDDVRGRLHVHEPNASYAEMYITPATASSEDSSMLFLAEDHDASLGMMWLYDGANNLLELHGKSNSVISGPHIQVQRDAGNVAIGADFAADHRLSVDGKIACEELRVEMSDAWPDYVFSKSHELMSIDELKTYIDQNAHLPNIPTAGTIESEGLEVGDMQRRMMEKIEELTLYVIDLNSALKQLSSENAELRERMNRHQTH